MYVFDDEETDSDVNLTFKALVAHLLRISS